MNHSQSAMISHPTLDNQGQTWLINHQHDNNKNTKRRIMLRAMMIEMSQNCCPSLFVIMQPCKLKAIEQMTRRQALLLSFYSLIFYCFHFININKLSWFLDNSNRKNDGNHSWVLIQIANVMHPLAAFITIILKQCWCHASTVGTVRVTETLTNKKPTIV